MYPLEIFELEMFKLRRGCHSVFDRENIQDLYRLSPTQEGILFHYLNDPGSQAYFEQTWFSG